MRAIVRTAISVPALRRTLPAMVAVGTTLTIVNSGPRLVEGSIDGWLLAKVAMTYGVPWLNATYGFIVGQRDKLVAA